MRYKSEEKFFEEKIFFSSFFSDFGMKLTSIQVTMSEVEVTKTSRRDIVYTLRNEHGHRLRDRDRDCMLG